MSKIQNTPAAMTSPPIKDNGALTQTLLVALMLEKIIPNPPSAVTNEAMVVGLNGEMPGMPVCSKPASA